MTRRAQTSTLAVPRRSTSAGLSLVALVGLVAPAVAAEPASVGDLVLKPSKFSVTETVDRLAAALEAKGIKPLARIDHAAAAKAVGLDLKPTTLLLFGNPKLGTPLMRANPTAAIDLPMRVVAFEDASGKVMVGYTAPATLKSRHSLAGVDAELDAMTKALEAFVAAATD
ncbi:MAG: DUF302 domain-containing protein [Hyphomicrobiaceae bacterium]|nr:DUF302 domain-containing protein [Hyphomicrobiaceae bacterium]